MSINLLASNDSHEATLKQIGQIDPDVIIFQEYTSRWHQKLTGELNNYPYSIVREVDSPFGIAGYSKLPFVDSQIVNIASVPAVDISVEVEDKNLRILGVHPIPPMSGATFDSRNEYLEVIATESRLHDGPMIVAGDFNAVPWSWHMKELQNNGGLNSARAGFGLKPTWPADFVLLWIPIDHILYNSHLSVIDFNTGESIGSDHKPIWAELSLL